MGRGAVIVELAEEAAGAEFVEVGGLVRIGDVPAVLGLDAEAIVVLRQVAELLEVGGQVGVDRAGDLASALVAEEVLGEELRQVDHPLVLQPAGELADETGVYLLEGLRLALELLAQPLDGGLLVADEEIELDQLAGGEASGVVLDDLFAQEEHAVAFGKSLAEPGVELGGRERDGDAALHVEGDHAVEEQVALAFGDDLGAAVGADEDREPPQVGADEVPGAVRRAGLQAEAVLQAAVGLVGGDHEILLDSGARDLSVRALLLVEGADVGDHEAGGEHGLLDGVPDGVAGVVEDDGDPAAGLEDTAVRLETALHQALVVGDLLALRAVDDGLGLGARAGAVPGLDDVVQIGVEDVLAEGRVGEHVVDGVVGEAVDAAVGG